MSDMLPQPPPSLERAFVLGAGLGTRLKTLTERLPKPLIPIYGKPLITFAFDQLIAQGVKQIVVNTHHCHEAYREAFPEEAYRGARLIFEHEPVLLETGGGLKNAERHLQGAPFLVYNGDVLANVHLAKAVAHHRAGGNEVTLVLRSNGEPRHVALKEGRIVDIAGRLGVTGADQYLFTGIYVVEPAFLKRIHEHTKISVIPIFMEMIKEGAPLGGVILDEGEWWDLGTREKYLEVHEALAHRDFPGYGQPSWVRIDPTAQIAKDARLQGFLAAGAGTVIEAGAQVTDCILWEGARVSAGSVLDRCIITSPARRQGGTPGSIFENENVA